MKKNLLLFIPALLGLLVSSCTTSEPTSSSQTQNSSDVVSSSETKSSEADPSSKQSDELSSSSEDDSSVSPSSEEEASSSLSSEDDSSATTSEVTKYTVTFESNGGSSVTSVEVEENGSLEKPTDPTKDGYKFVSWTTDSEGHNAVIWPLVITSDITLYANWNEKVDIKGYLKALMDARKQNPYSFIPESMQLENEDNYVDKAKLMHDYSTDTNLNNVAFGGFGEQWQMVIDNIRESEKFFSVISLCETIINSSVVLFNNYLDNNPEDTASHELDQTEYKAKLTFSSNVLSYTIQYKTGFDIPFFGTILPQIDMKYDLANNQKAVRVQLTENNAMKYITSDSQYVFAIEYGISTVSRKAYLQLDKDEDGNVTGHIYEFVQYKDKDLIPACADFYIGETYTSVVGNKASGLVGFNNYINELYKTEEGKLLGYEIRETKTVSSVSVVFNTLWFNLGDITGINSLKYIDYEHSGGDDSAIGFYVNGSSKLFKAKVVGGISKKMTSRRYDIEFRTQYFYNVDTDEQLTQYKVSVPMMFIQEEMLDTFANDVSSSNSGLTVSLNVNADDIAKIRSDYATLIDIFIANKDTITSSTIADYIGSAVII